MDAGERRGAHRKNNRHRYRRPHAGPAVIERGGYWHVVGTVRTGGRAIRIRRSTELPASAETLEDAEALRDRWVADLRREEIHGIAPTVSLAIAARDYLNRPRERSLGDTDIRIVQEITQSFRSRDLSDISEKEWNGFVDRRLAGRAPSTRERYLNGLLAFLNWCKARPRKWIPDVPSFDRDNAARNPNRRARRRVRDLSPDLIRILIDHASPHLKAQLATAWSTGARVSSLLHGCRLCDLQLAKGREQITFLDTKNGDPVTAALHPYAVDALKEYLTVRGRLEEREAPLFRTQSGAAYRSGIGSQNKTAFNAAKRRAAAAIRKAGGEAAEDRARLIEQVTMHWFRHLLADNLLKGGADLRTVMAQGGWRDPKSVMGYTRDVEAHRRHHVANLPFGGTTLTQEEETDEFSKGKSVS